MKGKGSKKELIRIIIIVSYEGNEMSIVINRDFSPQTKSFQTYGTTMQIMQNNDV